MKRNIRFELNNRANRNGEYNVQLLVSVDGKRRKQKTPIYVQRKSDFNASAKGAKWIRQSVHNAELLNNELAKLMEKAQKSAFELNDANNLTASRVISSLSHDSNNLIEFVKTDIENNKEKFAYSTSGNKKTMLNDLQKFMEEQKLNELLFKDITLDFLNRFAEFLLSRMKASTARQSLKNLKAILSRARKLGVMVENNPFELFEMPKVGESNKAKLTTEEVNRIISLQYEVNSTKWHVRNMFLLSMYCAGVRAGDLLLLRFGNVTEDLRLNYKMEKTNKVRNFKLVSQAVEIINLYRKENSKPADLIFPFMADNSMIAEIGINSTPTESLNYEQQREYVKKKKSVTGTINKQLKRIAKDAKIDKTLSTHIARHTFANRAKNAGINNGIIKELMAHSSLNVTEIYMGSFGDDQADKALDSLFSENNHKQNVVSMIKDMPESDCEKIEKLIGWLREMPKDKADEVLSLVESCVKGLKGESQDIIITNNRKGDVATIKN